MARQHKTRGRHGDANPRRRFWPSGIAGRLTLVFVGVMIIAVWTSAGLYVRDRAQTTFKLLSNSVADRVGVIVPLLEKTAPQERDTLLRALNSPTLWIGLTDGRRPRIPPGWRPDREHESEVEAVLPDLEERRIIIRRFNQWGRGEQAIPRMPGGRPAPPDLLNSRVKILVAVALKTGGWVHFVGSTDTTSLRWAVRMVFWIALTTVLILGISFWAVHRMTRPLRQFADAAERIGLDVRSPPLPERGSRELRNATRAFNRMQERLRRFVDDRTMMLAAISHDLRTMLTRLKLRAEFIEDAEQQRKAIADLDEMQDMLDSTLAFARDDAAEESRTQTDLAALVQSLCDDMADAHQPVTCTIAGRLPYVCAPGSIKRAVQNIVVNAVKYGEAADVDVQDGADQIDITVTDKGTGIPADRREDVFRPFFRLEASRNRETGGSGLGLAVARSIARRHGGDITLEDAENGGFTVRLSLPHTPMPEPHRPSSGATPA
jgi:signal transduction histidine kinase